MARKKRSRIATYLFGDPRQTTDEMIDDMFDSLKDLPPEDDGKPNTCFCGCGRKLGILERRINKNGRRTSERIEGLEEALRASRASQEAYEERGDQDAIEGGREMVDLIESLIEEGETYREEFRFGTHGVVGPKEDSARIVAGCSRWLRTTEVFRPMWEHPELFDSARENYLETGKFELPGGIE